MYANFNVILFRSTRNIAALIECGNDLDFGAAFAIGYHADLSFLKISVLNFLLV